MSVLHRLFVAVAITGLLTTGVALAPMTGGERAHLVASEFQYGISNQGSYCECPCYTGYCCDAPQVCEPA